MVVQVARNKELHEQRFSRGIPLGPVEKVGSAPNRRGTTVTFHADAEIFGHHKFKPARLFKSIRSKAYLFSGAILDFLVLRSEERLRRRQEKETQRKSATKKLRLPGKLTDCSSNSREGTELFIVEGDSAGGSAKMARNRKTQALLPLRGKILNVLGAASSKLGGEHQRPCTQAAWRRLGSRFNVRFLRNDKIHHHDRRRMWTAPISAALFD
ncbi:UNVERIFIED_CONTAM: hypothetical protein GTU68_055731 [Idotea baltica]|nr:hypothetical protein [Idotea baltica]